MDVFLRGTRHLRVLVMKGKKNKDRDQQHKDQQKEYVSQKHVQTQTQENITQVAAVSAHCVVVCGP